MYRSGMEEELQALRDQVTQLEHNLEQSEAGRQRLLDYIIQQHSIANASSYLGIKNRLEMQRRTASCPARLECQESVDRCRVTCPSIESWIVEQSMDGER